MKIFYVHNDFAHNEKVEIYNSYINGLGTKTPEEADVIVCGGGDGTLLKAIKEYRHLKKPFWGVNAGTVGFLMNDGYPHAPNHGDLAVRKFNLIKVKVHYTKSVRDLSSIDDKDVEVYSEYQAFNDVMIGGDMNSWIDFEITEKDDFFGNFKGGGLIVSTPQGSTGINKNNNGVVLPLSSKLWSITGDKTNRHIEYVIKPRKTVIEVKSRTDITVWVDGANEIIKRVRKAELSKGDTVEIMFGDYNAFKRKRRI